MAYVAVDTLVSNLQSLGYDSSPSAVLIDAINQAYMRVTAMRRWDWQEVTATATLTAGTDSVTTTLQHVDAVRLSDLTTGTYVAPTYMELHRLRAQSHEDTGNTGIPKYWSFGDGKVYVFPDADVAYQVTMDGRDTGAPYAAGATTDFPVRYQHVLLWGATVALAFRQRDLASASMAEQQFQDGLNAMIRQHGIKQLQGRLEVERHPFWDTVSR